MLVGSAPSMGWADVAQGGSMADQLRSEMRSLPRDEAAGMDAAPPGSQLPEGLLYVPNFLSLEEQQRIMQAIDMEVAGCDCLVVRLCA